MKIHLLHTNDIHSQIENHLRLGALLRTLRTTLEAAGEHVLTFDIGDVVDRVRPETEATFGAVNASMLGELQLDGWVFGNNEGLTIPVANWENLSKCSKATTFGTNLRKVDGTPFPWFEDTKIIRLPGLNVGVFGLTPNYQQPYAMLGIQVIDPIEAASRAAQELRSAGCHVVVCLSHLGLREDRLLAQMVAHIDVILGGHTHQFMPGLEQVGNTAIFQPGKHALVFGHTTIEYDPETERIVSVFSRPIPVPMDGSYDNQMQSAYKNYHTEIGEYLSEPVVKLFEPLPVLFDSESRFSNVLVDALFQAYPCDLGIMMAGALTASLLPGQITCQDVHAACLTPTRPLLMSLTGADILSIIEQGIQPEFYHRQVYGYGFRGAVLGYLALSNVRVELEQVSGRQRVKAVRVGEQQLEQNRLYRVITCEYLWLSSVFPEFRRGVDIEFKQPLVREVLLDHLADDNLVERAGKPRYLHT